MTTKKLRALLERKTEIVSRARAINDAATAEDRDLTDDEATAYDALMSELDGVNASIEREQRLIEEELSVGALEVRDGASITGGTPRVEEDPRRGFESFGEFAMAVRSAFSEHAVDDRLRIGAAAPSTYGNEGVGADGGFLVPPEFGREIWSLSTDLEEGAFLPLTDNMPVTGNSMVFPSDETTPWGSDGVRAYWSDEAAAATETKPLFKENTLRLNKLTAMVPVSNEMLADSTALPAYLQRKVGESIRWKTNDAIINGTGVGKPLGIANAPALVTQAKESGQTADTIQAENLVKMYSRLIRPGRGVWLVNPDAYPQLPLMSIGNQPVFTPPNGLAGAPNGMLLGRPIILTDTAQTVGDLGDIYFVDFGMYRTITKAGGIETATSMHLYFDADATAFRAVFRIAGQPALSSAVTPPNSTVTRSMAVTLAERA